MGPKQQAWVFMIGGCSPDRQHGELLGILRMLAVLFPGIQIILLYQYHSNWDNKYRKSQILRSKHYRRRTHAPQTRKHWSKRKKNTISRIMSENKTTLPSLRNQHWRKRCCKRTRGREELLHTDQHILNVSKTRRKNLGIPWIDYKKAVTKCMKYPTKSYSLSTRPCKPGEMNWQQEDKF